MNYAKEWDAEHERRLMYAEPLTVVREFFEDFDDPDEFKVLEIGCGAGSNAIWLADQGFDVTACDSSPAAIKRLHEMDPSRRVWAWVCDVATTSLPLADDWFDVVFEVRALENLNSLDALLAYRQMARVLKPTGLLLSVTASFARDLTTTTCGKVRRTTVPQMDTFLAESGLQMLEMFHRFDSVHDLCVIAFKD